MRGLIFISCLIVVYGCFNPPRISPFDKTTKPADIININNDIDDIIKPAGEVCKCKNMECCTPECKPHWCKCGVPEGGPHEPTLER